MKNTSLERNQVRHRRGYENPLCKKKNGERMHPPAEISSGANNFGAEPPGVMITGLANIL